MFIDIFYCLFFKYTKKKKQQHYRMLKKISGPVVHCFKLTEIWFIGRKLYALLCRDINYYYTECGFIVISE